jgi:hypothetical protein
MRALLRLVARIEVRGLEETPKSGGLIVAQPPGRLDPFLVYTLLDRTTSSCWSPRNTKNRHPALDSKAGGRYL